MIDMESGLHQEFEMINGRQVVKKHVATIHCSNKLSLLERKISNALLFHAFPHLKQQLVHEIRIDELKRLIGANTRNHKALKEALRKLICTVLEWNLLGENIPEMELEGWNASTILSSVSVVKGIIKYQYSELIKTLIIDPKIYGKINLAIQARFNSSYALALYENCARYRGLPYTKNIDIAIFRKLMGVEEGKYEIFRDFNRRVLNPAISEINTCSDIRVSPEITRIGRAVKSIKFKIEERPMKQRMGIQDTEKKIKVSSKTNDVFEGLKNEYGESRVEAAIQYVTSRPGYKKGKIKNMVGYVASAITNDYQEKNTDTNVKPQLTEDQKRNVSWVLHRTEYCRYITPEIIQQFCRWDDTKKQTALLAFMDCIQQAEKNKMGFCHNHFNIEMHYKKLGGTTDAFMKHAEKQHVHSVLFFEDGFSEFLIERYLEIKASVTSFEEFLDVIAA